MLKEALDQNQRELREQFPQVNKACESLLLTVAYKNGKPISQGSSVVIEGDQVVTAYHVIDGADDILLYTVAKGLNLSTVFDNGEITVDSQHPELDVAVFPLPEVFKSVVPSCETATANILLPQAFIIGFPLIDPGLKWPLYGRQPSIHPTRIFHNSFNELTTLSLGSEVIEVSNGMSGGAIVDFEGKVVGIERRSRQQLSSLAPACFYYGTSIDFVRSML